MIKYTILFFSMFTFLTTSEAATLYRHTLPFTASLEEDDVLVMDYDFSGKNGLRCTAANDSYQITFTYKGRQKLASLPIALQSHHVPQKKNEALADTAGKFTLSVHQGRDKNAVPVFCAYL